MRYWSVGEIAAIIAVMTLIGNPEVGRAEPRGGDYGAPAVVVPAPQDARFAHLSWPKITKTSDGTLVLAYVAGRQHVNGDGCPAVSISKDSGKTFSAPKILMTLDKTQEYQHCGNLALGVAADGAVVLLAMAFTDEIRNTIYGWRSTDSGQTWQPINTSNLGSSKTGSVFGHVFVVPGNGLAVCGHYRKPKGTGIWIAYSLDNGQTWGSPTTIDGGNLVEPTFISTPGRLIGLARENAAHAYLQFVRDDQGTTWQGPTPVLQGDRTAVYPSPFITVDPSDPARLYALQSQRTKTGEIFLWTADAATRQWKRLGLVATFPGCPDYSYPWMTHLAGNEWFVVFYAGKLVGPNSIYGLKLTISP